jgi:hypothetical protein
MIARHSAQTMPDTATIASVPARIEPQLTWSRESGWAYVATDRFSATTSSVVGFMIRAAEQATYRFACVEPCPSS